VCSHGYDCSLCSAGEALSCSPRLPIVPLCGQPLQDQRRRARCLPPSSKLPQYLCSHQRTPESSQAMATLNSSKKVCLDHGAHPKPLGFLITPFGLHVCSRTRVRSEGSSPGSSADASLAGVLPHQFLPPLVPTRVCTQPDGFKRNVTSLLFYPPPHRVPSYPLAPQGWRVAGPFYRGMPGQDYLRAPGPSRHLLSLWKPPSALFLGLLGLGEGIPMNMFVLFLLNRVLCNTEGSDYTGDPSREQTL